MHVWGVESLFFCVMMSYSSHVLPVVYTGEHELIEELFEQIKPGLSAYASDPRQVNLNIQF